MNSIVAIDCQVVKQQIASRFLYADWHMESKDILSKNLNAYMKKSVRYKDRHSVAVKSGVSARTIGSMMKGTGNHTLENITAVAGVFNLEAWELLIDHGEVKRRVISKIFDVDPAPNQVMGKPLGSRSKKTEKAEH